MADEPTPQGDHEIDESLFPDKEALDAAQKDWEGGKEESEKANPVGVFQARIASAELGRSTSSNRLQIHYELEIAVGDMKGAIVHKYDGLEGAKSTSITQQQLGRLGISVDKLNLRTLPAQLLALVDEMVMISCKQNNEFYNVYFQRRITGGVGSEAEKGQAAATGRTF